MMAIFKPGKFSIITTKARKYMCKFDANAFSLCYILSEGSPLTPQGRGDSFTSEMNAFTL